MPGLARRIRSVRAGLIERIDLNRGNPSGLQRLVALGRYERYARTKAAAGVVEVLTRSRGKARNFARTNPSLVRKGAGFLSGAGRYYLIFIVAP